MTCSNFHYPKTPSGPISRGLDFDLVGPWSESLFSPTQELNYGTCALPSVVGFLHACVILWVDEWICVRNPLHCPIQDRRRPDLSQLPGNVVENGHRLLQCFELCSRLVDN